MGEVATRMTALQRAGKKALVPFVTAGFPTRDVFPRLLEEVFRFADVVEIGVPFSDPLADGPVIQHTSQVALEQGVTLPWILEMLADRQVRASLSVPVVLMSYLNPLLQVSDGDVFERARRAGVAGVIIPDLPVEEGAVYEAAARDQQMDLIYLVAPTTSRERARLIADRSQGFVYLVSITGVTGARDAFPAETFEFLRRMRALTNKPLCVGFGISRPEQVKRLAPEVDGVIVGSSLLRAIMEAPSDPMGAVRRLLLPLRRALDESSSPLAINSE
ncbi:MAG: tryptophan synthase subunit alpha [Acidobacteria bacterium]|nr:MAG: tryptophan synthase subunit alpha [Acidobacteriota bacterium]